jgi:hypothetical protein
MNERIKELTEQAEIRFKKLYIPDTTYVHESPAEVTRERLQKFAELLIQEAAAFVGGAAEVYNQAEQDACVRASKGLMKHFGVEEPKGWVCPKCGIDRIKEACPNGHHATLTGHCPMVGVAL